MITSLYKIAFLLLAVALLTAPAVATQTEITAVVSDVQIHVDNSMKNIDYTANGLLNAELLPVFSGGKVVISLNNAPDGYTLKVLLQNGNNKQEIKGNPVTISGIFPATEGISVDVYLSLVAPPQKSDSPSQGSSVIVNPAVSQPQGIYTAPVENGSAAQFPASGIIFQVIMPDGYSGEVVLTTYKTPLSLGETNVYHQCDISIDGELANGETAIIRFKVPLSVLDARGLTAADVCLYYTADEGKTLKQCPTAYEVRGDIVYYEAVVDGFGLFTIAFEKGASSPAPGQTELPPTDVASPDISAVVAVGLLLVIGVLLVLLVLRRRD